MLLVNFYGQNFVREQIIWYEQDNFLISKLKSEGENEDLLEIGGATITYSGKVSIPLLISTGFLKYPLELKKKNQLELKKKFSYKLTEIFFQCSLKFFFS